MKIIPVYKGRLTMTEAGAIASVSAGTIQRAVKNGLLKADTRRKPYYISIEELLKLIENYLT